MRRDRPGKLPPLPESRPFAGSVALFAALVLVLLSAFSAFGQGDLEDRRIARIDITFEGTDRDVAAFEQFRNTVEDVLGPTYSAVRVRSALEALYRTDRIVSSTVEAERLGDEQVIVRFIIKRKSRVRRINVNVIEPQGSPITEADILLRLNLLSPGSAFTDRILEENASAILTYLRVRGFYNAQVDYQQQPVQNDTDVNVTFNVTPGEQAKVDEFRIDIDKFEKQAVAAELELQPGSPFSQRALSNDVELIRSALRGQGYFAPRIDDSRFVFDNETNTIDVEVTGAAGPVVNVVIDAEDVKIGESRKTDLLPILREATLDYSAIVEGERRLENYLQEQGYFFARVTPVCSVEPAFADDEAFETANGTEELCTALSGAPLSNRTVSVTYEADLRLRLKLVDIRLEGTDVLSIDEISSVLESQEASIIGIIPYLGYGRGRTSLDLLEQDRMTILSLMNELGYRNAQVGVRQGVSPNAEDLIITFIVEEGLPTKVSAIEIEGNNEFSDTELAAVVPNIAGENFSRAKARNGVRKLSQFYADKGYFNARVDYAMVEVDDRPEGDFDEIKLVYRVEQEGRRVVVNRVLITGNEDTKESAVMKAIDIAPGEVLRQTDIFTSEQNLYATDVFDLVEVKPEPAGETPDGQSELYDVLIGLTEKPPRLMTYGGGYSTDVGLSGFFDIRHYNLFGRFHQGGAQVRLSQRRQLVQFDYVNPRFLSDGVDENGKKRFAPITFSAQYQRDSTVTRFFRSTFDEGTFGIVQRVDEDGNPIDEFGNSTGDPTINNFSLSAETNRTLSRKDRTIFFLRYRFEDVRLFNFESLLIRELLRPDSKIRISGFTATFVRDTRKDCDIKYSLLEIISRGEPGERCRYSSGDPTDGDYLTAEYKFSTPILGANVGFNKFQISYNRYFTIDALNKTTLAGRAILGIANVFSGGNRFGGTDYPGLDGLLPISERFFAGGSTTLRGFDFEAAGPRVAVVPEGIFRNQQGEEITLNPFTIPFGGNGLAIVNLEARVPFTDNFRVVPFYDGGNVFRKASEIFNPSNEQPGDQFQSNVRAVWTHTIGLGLRIKTPFGGEFAVDYGYLLNPPKFIIPNDNGPDAILRLHQGQIHFRFSQAF
ncbi:MAG: BamA/TamA family outer membrane protein [Acidobacteriota bacterium]|nr:MAG: BamA/TamA family outer membrane protein [Acidobacteriota bacterium]